MRRRTGHLQAGDYGGRALRNGSRYHVPAGRDSRGKHRKPATRAAASGEARSGEKDSGGWLGGRDSNVPLVFLDADTDCSEVVLSAAVRAIRSAAVGGDARAPLDGSVPLYGNAVLRLWHLVQWSRRLASGCFIFCTRQAFEAAGGFHQALYAGEDAVLSRRLQRLGTFVIVQEDPLRQRPARPALCP